MKSPLIFLVLVILLHGLLLMPTSYAKDGLESDICANVYRVVDGDTLDTFPAGRVRLADINAPEIETSEGKIARDALSSLVDKYGPRIYLDVDDINVMDKYNRLVAVAYLRYNSTHLLNVNKWLVEEAYAEINDYDNEFNPDEWLLYIYHPADPCQGTKITLSTIVMTSITTVTRTITEMTTSTVTNTVISTVTAASTTAYDLDLAIIVIMVLFMAVAIIIGSSRRRRAAVKRR